MDDLDALLKQLGSQPATTAATPSPARPPSMNPAAVPQPEQQPAAAPQPTPMPAAFAMYGALGRMPAMAGYGFRGMPMTPQQAVLHAQMWQQQQQQQLAAFAQMQAMATQQQQSMRLPQPLARPPQSSNNLLAAILSDATAEQQAQIREAFTAFQARSINSVEFLQRMRQLIGEEKLAVLTRMFDPAASISQATGQSSASTTPGPSLPNASQASPSTSAAGGAASITKKRSGSTSSSGTATKRSRPDTATPSPAAPQQATVPSAIPTNLQQPSTSTIMMQRPGAGMGGVLGMSMPFMAPFMMNAATGAQAGSPTPPPSAATLFQQQQHHQQPTGPLTPTSRPILPASSATVSTPTAASQSSPQPITIAPAPTTIAASPVRFPQSQQQQSVAVEMPLISLTTESPAASSSAPTLPQQVSKKTSTKQAAPPPASAAPTLAEDEDNEMLLGGVDISAEEHLLRKQNTATTLTPPGGTILTTVAGMPTSAENFIVNLPALRARIEAIATVQGLAHISESAVYYLAQAVQDRLRNIITNAAHVSECRSGYALARDLQSFTPRPEIATLSSQDSASFGIAYDLALLDHTASALAVLQMRDAAIQLEHEDAAQHLAGDAQTHAMGPPPPAKKKRSALTAAGTGIGPSGTDTNSTVSATTSTNDAATAAFIAAGGNVKSWMTMGTTGTQAPQGGAAPARSSSPTGTAHKRQALIGPSGLPRRKPDMLAIPLTPEAANNPAAVPVPGTGPGPRSKRINVRDVLLALEQEGAATGTGGGKFNATGIGKVAARMWVKMREK